jgi:DegV family protein with EDD domain
LVRIVTDSTADLPAEIVTRYGITVVPLQVLFGAESFRDGVDIHPELFYRKLREAKELPTTSQPSPTEFAAVYRELARDGSPVVSLHLSLELSGTYQSARIGAAGVDGADITVIDTRSASIGLGLIVLEAAKAAQAGKSKEEIIFLLERLIAGSHLLLVVDTLEYLQKGGRIGKAQALLGSLLSIKPILILRDGVVTPLEKVRGQAKALTRLAELAAAEVSPDDRVIVSVAHAAAPEAAEALKTKIKPLFPNLAAIFTNEVGPVIGTHVGPGTLGIIVQELPQ